MGTVTSPATLTDLAGAVYLEGISKTALAPILKVSDILKDVNEALTGVKSVTFSGGNGVNAQAFKYSVQQTVRFYWIMNDDGEYVLKERENSVFVNHNFIATLEIIRTNGTVAHKNYAGSPGGFEKTHVPNSYGSLSNVCNAYVNGGFGYILNNTITDIYLSLANKSTYTISFNIPPYMEII